MPNSDRFSYRLPCALSFVLVSLLLLLAVPLVGQSVQMAHAATRVVQNGNDTGSGSLRQTIADAAAGDTITFDAVVDTVILTSTQLTIDKNLTIDGGATGVTVERDENVVDFRILEITGADTEVTLDSLTITNGTAPGNGGGILNSGGTLTVASSTLTDNSANGSGGGIANGGTLRINSSTISSNDSNFNGGGIYSTGNLRVTTSTLIDNTTARNGGGIYCDNMGTVTVLSSTLNRNTAGDFAGGIGQFSGELSIINSTVTGNEAERGAGGVRSYADNTMSVINSTINSNAIPESTTEGGGIRNEGTMALYNTIVANSIGDVDVDNRGGTLSAASSTIVADGSLTAPGITDNDPKLGPLQDNGGPTLTHLPQFGSSAINTGDNDIVDGTAPPADFNGDGMIDTNDTLDTEQRGFARIVGSSVDIGAVEVGARESVYLPLIVR